MKAIFLLLAVPLLFFSCKKGTDEAPPIGGAGGLATLKITPRHHGRQIDSCMIYVKYNTLNPPPADSSYDDSARCILINGVPTATFGNLKKGNYYFFGYGWDPLLSPPQAVRGGLPWIINEETLQSFDLPVSED